MLSFGPACNAALVLLCREQKEIGGHHDIARVRNLAYGGAVARIHNVDRDGTFALLAQRLGAPDLLRAGCRVIDFLRVLPEYHGSLAHSGYTDAG